MSLSVLLPSGWSAILWILLLEIVAHVGLWVHNHYKWFKNTTFANEFVSVIFSVLSLIYSLLLAFVIVAVWENYENLNRTIERESDHLSSVLVHSEMLPDSLKTEVRDYIRLYCDQVSEREWDMLETPERYRPSAIPNLRLLLFKVESTTKATENVLSVLDQDLSDISSLRRERLTHTRSYVPGLVWDILLAGTFLVIVFSYLFQSKDQRLKRLILSFLWAMMGMSLFLLYALDHPFSGSTQVSRQPYESITHSLENVHPH